MSAVLGLDLSTKAIELVRLDESSNAAAWDHLQLEGHLALDRLRDVPRRMPRWNSEFYDDIYLVAVEAPYARAGIGALAKLSRVFGAIVACIPPRLEVWEIAPHDWRTEITVPGNAPKEACAARCIELGARPDWNDENAYDAFAVAYAARQINARAISPTTKEAAA